MQGGLDWEMIAMFAAGISGAIIAWDWTVRMATTLTQTTSGPKLTMPSITCSLLPPPPLPA